MVNSKALIATLVLFLIAIHVVEGLQSNPGNVVTGAKIDCPAACGVRCSATKRPNLCKRACGSCCNACNCVPPGTSGNYDVCPCYANKTTHGNVRKCP